MLKAYANDVRWVLYRRADKCPVHPETLLPINAQDPGNWMRGTVAFTWAQFLGPDYGPGIVLWKGGKLVCLDIDKALVNGAWSPLARELCERFKGAYIEVSQSGTGVHIFATVPNDMPPHRKKNVPLHIELYSELRFIGVTGTNATGDEAFDASHLIPKLISDYFQPTAETGAGGWTTEPAPEWDGPEDDEELMRRMISIKSPGAVFGNKASFHDLLTANVDKLAIAFPPQTAGKDYDGSSADQAFFNTLAFFTGGNCERMLSISERPEVALRRPKWEREGYLRGTIANASAWQKTFYKQRPGLIPAPAPAVTVATRAAPPPTPQEWAASAQPTEIAPGVIMPANEAPAQPKPDTKHGGVLTGAAQKLLFDGCTYVQDINQVMVPEGHTLKRETFDNDKRFRGRTYILDASGQQSGDSAWDAFTQSKLIEFDTVRGTYFDPRQPEGARIQRAGQDYANTWKDPKIHSEPGDVTLYLTHLQKLFPNGDDALIYLSFVAACVQYQGHKSTWALFVQGTPGNGKSFLTSVMRYCLGEDYVHSASASNLDNRFNGYLYRKLLILVEEIKTIEGNASLWEKLKTLITEPRQEIEAKGVDQVTREVCFNMIFNSNHRDGIRKTDDDRRICPLFSAQQSKEDLVRDGMDEKYFMRLWAWYQGGGNANILHYLKEFPIPPKYDFTKEAVRAPLTTSTNEAISAGLGSAEQDILEAIGAGRTGFKGGWINSRALDKLLAENGRGRFIAANKRREMLEGLGYLPHPQLPDGRLNAALADGTKPRLYVKRGHSSEGVSMQAMLRQMYEAAQKGA